jgi:hypothetical protein
MRTVFRTSKRSILGGIALAALLTMPMACATTDDSDSSDSTSETTEKLSTSFLFSCWSGSFSQGLDTSTMRLFISHANANGCERLNGSRTGAIQWPPGGGTGRCFNDLSNRNGVLTCAGG